MTKREDANDLEQRLLSQSSIDELIKMKMEEEIQAEFKKAQEKPKRQVITDISKVPKELIFSKKAVYKVFNRINKTETYINGMQAEAMLGLQNSTREKIQAGKMDAFSNDILYVKFEKIEF